MNFKEIEVKNIEGEVEKIDFSKQIGNALYSNGKDVEICEAGKDIYFGKDVELTEPVKDFVRAIISEYPYIFRTAIEEMMK